MHAFYYAALSICFLMVTIFLPALCKSIFAWFGLSYLAVAIAYAFNNLSIFRKRTDGRIPWWTRWLFVPFLLAAQAYNRVKITFEKEPLYHKIDDGLYLAGRLTGRHLAAIANHGIDAILDTTAEFDALQTTSLERNIDYLNVPNLFRSAHPH